MNNRKQTKKKTPRRKGAGTVPASYARFVATKPATMAASRSGKIVVTNEEYLQDVATSQGFRANVVKLNPGLIASFPWLSPIANCYEFYKFLNLSFIYKPIVGTGTSAQMLMAIDFDAADDAPDSKQRMMSFMGSIQGPAYREIVCDAKKVNLDKFTLQRYTRSSDPAANKDIKTYDVGNLWYAALAENVVTCGSIYVRYTVELSTPHTQPNTPEDFSAVLQTGASSLAAPLTGALINNATSLPILDARLNNTLIVKKAGEYLMQEVLTGTGVTGVTGPQAWAPNADAGSTIVSGNSMINATATQLIRTSKIKTTTPDAAFSWVQPAWGALSALTVRIMPYENSLVSNP